MTPLILRGFPMPPSINAAFANRQGPGRGRFKTAVYRAFEAEVALWAASNQRGLGVVRDFVADTKPGQWLHLDAQFHFPRTKLITKDNRPKRLDADNRIKLGTDALTDLLRIDDSLIGGGSYRKIPTPGAAPAYVDFVISWMSVEG